ncbi:hypothetical protein GFS60_01857 [Rhodococcus sp. WAY2]|nr:hypothetical protein GFS60_01857 [Rhodococcus sp. WAY2]
MPISAATWAMGRDGNVRRLGGGLRRTAERYGFSTDGIFLSTDALAGLLMLPSEVLLPFAQPMPHPASTTS